MGLIHEDGRWLEVSAALYMGVFYELGARGNKWGVFSSFTDPDGSCHYGYGCPAADTEWGLKDSDFPMLRVEWRGPRGSDTEKSTYYLFIPHKAKDDDTFTS